MSRWNFDHYIDNGSNTGLTYQLFMDVNPTLVQTYKSFGPSPVAGVLQASLNLGFDTFEAGLGYAVN